MGKPSDEAMKRAREVELDWIATAKTGGCLSTKIALAIDKAVEEAEARMKEAFADIQTRYENLLDEIKYGATAD